MTITTSMGTSMLTITGVQEVNAGTYRCLATNSEGSVTSEPATLQLASESVCGLSCLTDVCVDP